MTELRNIGYLRFGSKIQQGFAVATPSLTSRLSFFSLWMLFAANADVEPKGTSAFILGEPTAPMPGGRTLHAKCLSPSDHPTRGEVSVYRITSGLRARCARIIPL